MAEGPLDAALALLQDGQADVAAAQLASIPRSARDAIWHSRMALADLLRDRFADALANYARAADLDPATPDHLVNHAAALVRLHRLEEALALYDRVLAIVPDHVVAGPARTAVLLEIGRGADAVDELAKQLADRPDSLEARIALFNAHSRLGADGEAVQVIAEALEPFAGLAVHRDAAAGSDGATLFERQAALRWALHGHFCARQQWMRAVAVLNQLRIMHGDAVPPEVRIAWTDAVGDLKDEARAFAELEALEGDFADDDTQRVPLATLRVSLLLKAQREPEALEHIETAEGVAGEALRGSAHHAQALTLMGRLDEAATLLETLATREPQAFVQLVNTRTLGDHPAAETVLRRIADHPMTPTLAREAAGFALASLLDAKRNAEGAMHYLELANDLAARAIAFNPDSFTLQVDLAIRTFDAAWFADRPRLPASDPVPVFVLGMPRSGTTLTESILGSHPDVFAAGELSDITRITRMMPRVFPRQEPPFYYPGISRSLSRDEWIACATHYLNCLGEHTKDHRFVVDKMPHNFVHAAAIHTMFPHGRIIHVRRDPRDVALSNYQQNFSARFGGLGYAFDLEHIARQLNDYHRLMEHYRQIGVPMFELFYEDLVADQERVTRQLLEFIGADWNAGVLDFTNLDRAVRTASVAQVRKPVYQTSRQKWRRYEAWLGPLLDQLDPAVAAPWD